MWACESRQLRGEMLLDRGARIACRRCIASQRDVRDELATGGPLGRNDGGLAHRRMGGKHGFHFTKLHPVSRHLDLVVDPAQENQMAIGFATHPVAAAVDAFRRHS